MTNSEKTKKYVSIAVFCAVAYICTLVFRIKVSFLTFDIKDSIITVGALFFGPMAGAVISLVAALLELTVSDTGLYGFIMNFVSSAIFAVVPAACYKYRKNLTTAIFGLTIGVVCMTAGMLIMNLLITPFYMGVERSQVASLIPTLLLPFNLIKGVFNAAFTVVLYKPISNAMHRTGILTRENDANGYVLGKKSIIVAVIGAIVALACALIFIFVLKGSFELV